MICLQRVAFCGCPGQLSAVGADPLGAEGCFVWRTDAQLLGVQPVAASLLNLACDVADLYHHKHVLRLADVPGELEVIWLELAADGSLLVFFKACSLSRLCLARCPKRSLPGPARPTRAL
jgi:hypothetical protein